MNINNIDNAVDSLPIESSQIKSKFKTFAWFGLGYVFFRLLGATLPAIAKVLEQATQESGGF